MARETFLSTTEWQQVATGVAVFTILKRGKGTLFVNETATETDANRLGSETKVNDQFQQFSDVETRIKHNAGATPWSLLVDGDVFIPPLVTNVTNGNGDLVTNGNGDQIVT